MSTWFSFIISILSFIVSVLTIWLTFFRKGHLKMTKPTIIFFGPDGPKYDGGFNKIYLRTLFYSTSKSGQVIESLYVSINRNESKQNFSIWIYGEKGNLKRGSGIFIPMEGVTYDHNFLLPRDGFSFDFLPGLYKLNIFAKIVGKTKADLLCSVDLDISEKQSSELKENGTGIYFDWGPDQQKYYSHIERLNDF